MNRILLEKAINDAEHIPNDIKWSLIEKLNEVSNEKNISEWEEWIDNQYIVHDKIQSFHIDSIKKSFIWTIMLHCHYQTDESIPITDYIFSLFKKYNPNMGKTIKSFFNETIKRDFHNMQNHYQLNWDYIDENNDLYPYKQKFIYLKQLTEQIGVL